MGDRQRPHTQTNQHKNNRTDSTNPIKMNRKDINDINIDAKETSIDPNFEAVFNRTIGDEDLVRQEPDKLDSQSKQDL